MAFQTRHHHILRIHLHFSHTNKIAFFVTSDFLTELNKNIFKITWDMTPCSLLYWHERFCGICYLRIPGKALNLII